SCSLPMSLTSIIPSTPTDFCTLSLHDALPICFAGIPPQGSYLYRFPVRQSGTYWYHAHSGFQEQLGLYGPLIIDPLEPEPFAYRSEEHTSELQSRENLVCRLLLEKKNKHKVKT